MKFIVVCRRDEVRRGVKEEYVLATSRQFDTRIEALIYEGGIAEGREPIVVEVEEEQSTEQLFLVELTAKAIVTAKVRIRASNTAAAERAALEQAHAGDVVWNYDGAEDRTVQVELVTAEPVHV